MDGILGCIERKWPAVEERAGRPITDGGRTRALAAAGLSELARVMAGCEPVLTSGAPGFGPEAVEPARRALTFLDRPGPLELAGWDPEPSAAAFDPFFVEWQRAGWLDAGRLDAEDEAKRRLLRWRLHAWLARVTGDLAHHYEAVLARPDLPATRAALGIALARAGRPHEARNHLGQAVAEDPFDLNAVRALEKLMDSAADSHQRIRLARDRHLLAQAAPELVPREPWFADAPPVGDELASIIILCCNQLEFTRICLESVLRHTRPPYELVLVDNASNDGTAVYLDEVAARTGPARVEIVRNAMNLGFAAGCNQALARARGRYLVLLNNDTIVTEGWLDGLVAWSLDDWPKVGLVGAVSNAAAPPQQVEIDYEDPAKAGEFAARRCREFAGRAVTVERLTGFCLLIRREVLDQVGGLDESYGLGFFDDDDLCVRAREAGFQLLLALNVFVHHFGGRTFAGLGIDCRRQLEENFARFRAKWGPERSAGYHLAPPVSGSTGPSRPHAARSREPVGVEHFRTLAVDFATPGRFGRPVSRPRVSLCLIVKNEETNLPDCLACAGDLVEEVIVVDTGSTDRTRELATRLGAQVFDFAWVDDFAAARNEALRHATGEWIFWLDADDRLDEAERHKLRTLFADLKDENVAYVMKCLCPADSAHAPGSDTVVDHIRLFRNDPQIRWQYRVHEQIMPSVRRQGVRVEWADITIRHIGYQDPTLRRAKLERDLRLLQRSVAEQPDEPFVLFNMGSVYLELGRTAEALPLLKRSLERSHPGDSIVRKLYALAVQCHRRLDQPEEALKTCRAGREVYRDDAELLFQEGLILRGLGDPNGAETCLLRLLSSREGDHFASIDPGLRGYKARHNLAVLYRDQGRVDEALVQWRAVTDERPDFTPAWLGLAELFLSLGRWAELDVVLGRLEERPAGEEEAALLRARSLLKRKEFSLARGILDGAISRTPRAVKPWIILSHVLLQEGRDPEAAERALREILALDPVNTEARHNLAVLLSRSSRSA